MLLDLVSCKVAIDFLYMGELTRFEEWIRVSTHIVGA
jgi:hypothetical protein